MTRGACPFLTAHIRAVQHSVCESASMPFQVFGRGRTSHRQCATKGLGAKKTTVEKIVRLMPGGSSKWDEGKRWRWEVPNLCGLHRAWRWRLCGSCKAHTRTQTNTKAHTYLDGIPFKSWVHRHRKGKRWIKEMRGRRKNKTERDTRAHITHNPWQQGQSSLMTAFIRHVVPES